MSIRRLIVEVSLDGLNVTRFCADHGVTTWFFYDLRRRYQREGDTALEPKSRAPKTVWNKTSVEVEDLIVATRKHLEGHGLDYGSDEVVAALEGRLDRVPSSSTVYRVLKARGFITAEPQKAPKHTGHRFTAARANESWQLDDMGWELPGGEEVKILNVLDDHSRLLPESRALAACTGEAALEVVAAGAAILGWPARFQSDNFSGFRYTLAEALRAFGVAAAHSRPHHPQTNGKVERFHQTLRKWLAAQNPASTIDELQAQLDLFRLYYNHHRRHRGIDRRIPADVWTAAPKAGPADRPLQPPSTVHHHTVNNGRISIGDRYSISIGVAHNHKPALTIITGLACHVFIHGRLTRHLTLDPTRRVQPLHDRPGRPSVTTNPHV